jgi:hypothetical protein
MKNLISSLLFVSALFFSKNVTAAKNVADVKVKSHQKTYNVFLPTYFFVMLGDNCFHLVRLNDPGYTDAYGNYFSGPSVTFLGASEWAGTTTICPSNGDLYC